MRSISLLSIFLFLASCSTSKTQLSKRQLASVSSHSHRLYQEVNTILKEKVLLAIKDYAGEAIASRSNLENAICMGFVFSDNNFLTGSCIIKSVGGIIGESEYKVGFLLSIKASKKGENSKKVLEVELLGTEDY